MRTFAIEGLPRTATLPLHLRELRGKGGRERGRADKGKPPTILRTGGEVAKPPGGGGLSGKEERGSL